MSMVLATHFLAIRRAKCYQAHERADQTITSGATAFAVRSRKMVFGLNATQSVPSVRKMLLTG